MPLQRRVPKFGFRNVNRKEYKPINLDRLQDLIDRKGVEGDLTLEVLVAHGLVGSNDLVKVLGNGELKGKIKVSAHKFSESAKKAIEDAGGEAITI